MITNVDSNQRFLYPVADIKEGKRIRQNYGDLPALANSIKENGLLHPIVINTKGELIAGGRRFRAYRDVLKAEEIPVTFFEFANEAELRILEREENVQRLAMSWQEEVESIADVHRHHAYQAALSSKRWTQRASGALLGMSEANISYTLQIAELLRKGDKEVKDCVRFTDAINLLVKRRAEESNRIVANLTLPKVDVTAAKAALANTVLGDTEDSIYSSAVGESSGGVASPTDDDEMPVTITAQPASTPDIADAKVSVPLSRMLLLGDSVEILTQLPLSVFDHCITDWPYAIDMDMIDAGNPHAKLKNVEDTRDEHDVEENEKLHADILPQIYRVLKPGGFFITCCDYIQFGRSHDLAVAAGFRVQRWPNIWFKTSRVSNKAANYNFPKNHEAIMVCRKENGTLTAPQPTSIFTGSNEAEEKALGHAFAKPFKLWEWLYSAVCLRGQTVLDPFAGRGSSTLAALNYGLNPVAIEKRAEHHSALVVHVSEWYKRQFKNVDFT